MNEFFNSPVFHLTLTLLVYVMSQKFYKNFKYIIFHPLLVSIVVLIIYMKLTQTPFETYKNNTQMITFWLSPSVVALGLPLYLYLKTLKGNVTRVLLAIFFGSFVGIVSVVLIAKLLGASDEVIVSLSPKSITTPVAMQISKSMGGNEALTIAVVFITGFLGALFGWEFFKLLGIKNPLAIGIGTGAASHAVGTAEIVKKDEKFGAYGALGLALTAVTTAVLCPIIVPLLLKWLQGF